MFSTAAVAFRGKISLAVNTVESMLANFLSSTGEATRLTVNGQQSTSADAALETEMLEGDDRSPLSLQRFE